MRTFNNVAALIKKTRLEHPKKYSQSQLSYLLGYKNGQFVSNVERGLCSIPLKMLSITCRVLEIDPSILKEALLRDQSETLNRYLSMDTGLEEVIK